MKNIYNYIKGSCSTHLLYPVVQATQKRKISPKINILRKAYKKKYALRKKNNIESLISVLEHSKRHVPYYRDLFKAIGFEPAALREDMSLFGAVPYLTKELILEQGERMFSDGGLARKYFVFKTGGSTGNSANIYYDQDAYDWSSAITFYAREQVGHKNWKSEVHFASEFPEVFPLKDRLKEFMKCFVMNRSNIFFDALDAESLQNIFWQLKKINPHLVHAHPSTIYSLALWAKEKNEKEKVFNIFESSGELLGDRKRRIISEALNCKVIDRYGLAEFGVVAYQLNGNDLQVFDSFVYPETKYVNSKGEVPELVFTGLTNYLMPLIKYRTGDRGNIEETPNGFVIENIVGRMHDMVDINGKQYPTHYIQDVLDRVGGVKEFQIILQKDESMILTLVSEEGVNNQLTKQKIESYWPDAFHIRFVALNDLIKVGWREKFRYVVKQQ